MALEICPSCGKKQFNASSRKCYACRIEKRKDGTLVKVPEGYILDSNGNIRTPNNYEKKDGKLYVDYHYILEEGKTTLRGEYPKLAEPPKCVYPDRLSCNGEEGCNRCEFMKRTEGGYGGTWVCEAIGKKKA
jgi:hypothetical protein